MKARERLRDEVLKLLARQRRSAKNVYLPKEANIGNTVRAGAEWARASVDVRIRQNELEASGAARDPQRFLSVPTSAQIDEAKCKQIGQPRCPFEITTLPVSDGRKAGITNSGFGTVQRRSSSQTCRKSERLFSERASKAALIAYIGRKFDSRLGFQMSTGR